MARPTNGRSHRPNLPQETWHRDPWKIVQQQRLHVNDLSRGLMSPSLLFSSFSFQPILIRELPMLRLVIGLSRKEKRKRKGKAVSVLWFAVSLSCFLFRRTRDQPPKDMTTDCIAGQVSISARLIPVGDKVIPWKSSPSSFSSYFPIENRKWRRR